MNPKLSRAHASINGALRVLTLCWLALTYGLNRRGNCSRIISPPKEWKLAMALRPTASRIEYLITYRP